MIQRIFRSASSKGATAGPTKTAEQKNSSRKAPGLRHYMYKRHSNKEFATRPPFFFY